MRQSTLKLATFGLVMSSAAWSIPVSLADSTTKLDVGVMMQNRAEHNWAETSAGKTFDVNRGKAGEADAVDFYGRRARLNISGEREGWKALLTFSADKSDLTGYNSKERAAQLLYLWVQKTVATGELSHVVTVGLDQPNVEPAYRDPSSQLLLPTPRATILYPTAANAFGVRYQLNHKLFQISLDVQNNRDTGRASQSETDGLFYGARAVVSLIPGAALPKRTESFAGEAGTALALGIDGTIDHSYVQVGAAKDTILASYASAGADILFHMDGLTADVDARVQKYYRPTNKILSYAVSVQAGYAIPVPALGIVVEPALRGSVIDKDVDNDEATIVSYSSSAESEHGNSGYEEEAGLNIYFKGHSNKLQIAFQRWDSENSDANANILRVQHQFSF